MSMLRWVAYELAVGGWPRRKLGEFECRFGVEDEVAARLYRRRAKVVVWGGAEHRTVERQLGAWRGLEVAHG